jgi:ribonuclease VapC
VILDTSVLLAILFNEPDSMQWLDVIEKHRKENLSMSVANYLEAVLRVDALKDRSLVANLEELVEALGVELLPVSVKQMQIAREANLLFGKNASSKAKLNYGDLFAYALAKESKRHLLYKGNDFIHTGIQAYRFDLDRL